MRRFLAKVDSWLYWNIGPMAWHPDIHTINEAAPGRWRHLRDDPRFQETFSVIARIKERRRRSG